MRPGGGKRAGGSWVSDWWSGGRALNVFIYCLSTSLHELRVPLSAIPHPHSPTRQQSWVAQHPKSLCLEPELSGEKQSLHSTTHLTLFLAFLLTTPREAHGDGQHSVEGFQLQKAPSLLRQSMEAVRKDADSPTVLPLTLQGGTPEPQTGGCHKSTQTHVWPLTLLISQSGRAERNPWHQGG